MGDAAAQAAAHWHAMDLAFPGRPRETWHARTRQEQDDWWALQRAVDVFNEATYSPDRMRPRP